MKKVLVLFDIKLYQSYTYDMKTAISIPDEIYKDAENVANQLGLARSQLYTEAIKEFCTKHNRENIAEQLNKIYSSSDTTDTPLLDAGLNSLREATKNDTW